MEALILAGGPGSRLGSLTKSKPKPLLPVGGRPFLEWTLENLKAQGIRKFVISTGYLGEQVESYFGKDFLGIPIDFVHESEQLGTAGALLFALPRIQGENFLLCSGDVYQKFSVEEFLEFHLLHEAEATVAVQQSVPRARSGTAEITPDGKVANIFRVRRGSRRETNVLTGAILFRRSALGGLSLPKSEIGSPMLETELLPILVKRGAVYAKPVSAPYLDIGRLENYRTANQKLIELTH